MDQTINDSYYFAQRASEEQAAADRADDPRARQTHIDLAKLYSRAAQACGREAADSQLVPEAHEVAPVLQPEFRILP